MKKTVLITGGSSGIGYELSRLFARDHYRLLWVSKPPEELAQAEEKIQQEENKPEVHSLAIDLSRPTAAREVLEWTRDKEWEVDVLVNNAGFGSYGFFPENSLEKERTMVALNVQNVFVMTHLFLKDMIKRKKGLIINVASS
ncbi:MAG: SDR family NAD(P)-dependent oxidoreductase, partial [Bacteroidota bacterium]